MSAHAPVAAPGPLAYGRHCVRGSRSLPADAGGGADPGGAADPATGARRWPFLSRWQPALVPVVLSALLSLPFLARSPLWADEADSVSAATRSYRQLALLLRHQDGPLAAYYLVLHSWVRLVGTSSWALRLPSAVAVLIAVACTYAIGRHLSGTAGGVLAGSLLATNPFVASFALDARPYAFALAAAAGLGLLLVSSPAEPSRRRRAGYAVLVITGTLSHLFFLLLLPAQAAALLWTGRPRRPWLLPAAVALVVLAPVVLLSAGQTQEVAYLHRPGWVSLAGWFQAMAGGQPWLAAGAVGVLLGLRLRRGAHPFLLAWLVVPGPVLLLISLVHPLYLNRYVVESAPALSLLLALVITGWRRRASAVAVALALVFAGGATSAYRQSAPYRYEDLRAAADTVLDRSRPGDGAVYLPSGVRTAAGFYLARLDAGAPVPVDLLAGPGGDENTLGNFGGRMVDPLPASLRLLSRRTVWLLSYADSARHAGPTATAVLALLRHQYAAGPVQRFGLLVVQRFQRLRR